MTKRRAEQVLFHDVPSKKCVGLSGCFDTQLESMAATGDLSPPSLLALLGSRCRKRPFYFEDEEESRGKMQPRKIATIDHRICALVSSPTTTSGSFLDRSCANSVSSSINSKKRTREGSSVSKTASPEVATQKHENDDEDDLSRFNSFQYWRIPLPQLDLSLINTGDAEDANKLSCVKDSSDAMET